jgi:hypothetical protein
MVYVAKLCLYSLAGLWVRFEKLYIVLACLWVRLKKKMQDYKKNKNGDFTFVESLGRCEK